MQKTLVLLFVYFYLFTGSVNMLSVNAICLAPVPWQKVQLNMHRGISRCTCLRLTPLSVIFQLFHRSQFLGDNLGRVTNNRHTLSHIVIQSIPRQWAWIKLITDRHQMDTGRYIQLPYDHSNDWRKHNMTNNKN